MDNRVGDDSKSSKLK